MAFRYLATLFALLMLAGCAGSSTQSPLNTSSRSPVSGQKPLALNKTFDFDIPVVQDRTTQKQLTAQEARSLERRTGYLVDHSIRSTGVNKRIRYLVLHYTGSDEASALQSLTSGGVGVHYLILNQPATYQGKPAVLQLADESMRAWHAGYSVWGHSTGLNDSSIGIEIVNPGYTKTSTGLIFSPFSESQIRLLIALAKDIIKRYDIDPVNVVGHSDIAPGRKLDPGPFFPWEELYRAGIGAWPDDPTVAMYMNRFANGNMPSVRALQQGLARYGYDVEESGYQDELTRRALVSFQMHFRPTNYSGHYDQQSAAILFALLDKYCGANVTRSLLTD